MKNVLHSIDSAQAIVPCCYAAYATAVKRIHSSHQLSFSDTKTAILLEPREGYMALDQKTSGTLSVISEKTPPGISALDCNEYGDITVPPTHNPYYSLN